MFLNSIGDEFEAKLLLIMLAFLLGLWLVILISLCALFKPEDFSSSLSFFVMERPLIIFGEAIVLIGEERFSVFYLNSFFNVKKPLAQGSFSCKMDISE